MMENLEQDHEIQEALKTSLHSEEPSDELMRNLRLLAGKTAPTKRPWWQSRVAIVGTCAAGLAIVALTMVPTQAAAKSYGMLLTAAERVNTFQFTIDANEKGEHELLTIAGAGGQVFLRSSEGTVMEVSGGGLSFYEPKSNVVTRFKLGGLVDSKMIANQIQSGISQGLNEMDLKKMLKDYEKQYGKDHIKISAVAKEGGKDVYHVTLASKDDPSRVDMKVDAASDLPELIVVEQNEGGAWTQTMKMEMRFGSSVDPHFLHADFPSKAKVVDINLDSMVSDAVKGIQSMAPVIGKFNPALAAKAKSLTIPSTGKKD